MQQQIYRHNANPLLGSFLIPKRSTGMKQTPQQALSSALEAKVELLKINLGQLKKKSSDLKLKEKIQTNEVCNLLNISPRTLKTLRANREIAYVQIERKIYYRSEDIEDYISKLKGSDE